MPLTEEERKQLEEKLFSQIIPTNISLSNLENEAFVGMWKDRENMEDSRQWVRQHRQIAATAIVRNIPLLL